MTATELVQKVLTVAAGEVGVKESPAGTNNVKYNTDYYGQPVHDGLWNTKFPWCCVFVWWVFAKAGLPGLFYAGGKTASCTTLWSWFKGFDRIVPFDQAQPGDIVFFRWTSGQKTPQHVGIVESRSGDTLTTIEGNTAVGNDGNGGAVMRRTRKANVVFAVARPLYQVEEEKGMNKCTVKIKLADIERIAVVFGNGRSLDQVKANQGCDYIINGGLYDTAPVCHLKVDGVVKAKDQWGYIGYGWDQGPDIHELAVPEEGGQARNYIACVQLLGRGMKLGDKPIYGKELGGKRGRTAMALTQDSLILYCTKDGSAFANTPEELQKELAAEMGATSALMLDSGGSSQCDVGGGQTVTSSRKVNNYICVWLKKTPIGKYMVTTNKDPLAIRKTPGGTKVDSYNKGTVAEVLEVSDGWARTVDGWCSMAYLTPVAEAPAATVQPETPATSTADQPDDWAKAAWEWAKDKGLLDGTRPRDNITRQELAVVLDRLGLI